jgi:hypothetical protein
MNSTILKTEALCFLRYVKKMDLVCTEGGPWNSDVLGTTDSYSIEIEVKTSRADLLAEFRNKKAKHSSYGTGDRWCPNYFYFLVPPELAESTAVLVAERMPKAGVLSLLGVFTNSSRRADGRKLVVVRKARKLRDRKPTDSFKRQIMLRMGSELCGMHLALDRLRADLITGVDAIKGAVVDAIVSTEGLQEWEQEPNETYANEGSVQPRGSEIPGCSGE